MSDLSFVPDKTLIAELAARGYIVRHTSEGSIKLSFHRIPSEVEHTEAAFKWEAVAMIAAQLRPYHIHYKHEALAPTHGGPQFNAMLRII